MSFLENQIISKLRKESIPEPEELIFTELFRLYFDMQDRNLQAAAEMWYSSTIQDIEREVAEAEEDKREALRQKLARKYFKHKKGN